MRVDGDCGRCGLWKSDVAVLNPERGIQQLCR